MKKTLTMELVISILFVLLGVLGFYFLGATAKAWLLPVFTAVVLLAYLVRWQFIMVASVLMPLITALLTLQNGFSTVSLVIEIVTLLASGLLVCFSYQRWKWGAHPSLVFGIACGVVIGGLVAWLMHGLFSMGSFENLYTYVICCLEENLKGFVVELAIVPLIVLLVFQRIFKTGKRR